MPVVRFARDRRGYESTFLVSTGRGRPGEREENRLFYWFRTPPHLKVGRAAFDEDAIRELEDGHPEVDFDWRHILAAKAPPAESHEDGRSPRFQGRRSADSPSRPQPAVRTPVPVARPAPVERAGSSTPSPAPAPAETPEIAPAVVSAPTPPPPPEPEATPDDMPIRRFVRVFDAPLTDEPPHHLSDPSASEQILGIEQLGRLRGQYSAALARIGRRVGDPREAETLRATAERANPDAWVTADDVKAGLAGLDAVYAEIARTVGRRRRRRRSRGQRVGGPAPEQTETSSGVAAPDNGSEEGDGDDSPDDSGSDD